MKPFCAAVDWGTSRFRLWILARDGSVLQQTSSDEGLLIAAEKGFENILERHLSSFNCPASLPVIICGMAGSRSGWHEAPYLDSPVAISQIISNVVAVPDQSREILILPGIAQRDPEEPDVMRGEETQLFGVLSDAPNRRSDKLLVCMPGTHSKWVTIENDCVEQFYTFVTGELFAILSKHSILRQAVDAQSQADPNHVAYLQKVHLAVNKPAEITHQLFALRSSQLLGYDAPGKGAAALSGLIIGLELAGVFSKFGKFKKATLLASGKLGGLYKAALESFEIEIIEIDAESAGRKGLYAAASAIWGHEQSIQLRKI